MSGMLKNLNSKILILFLFSCNHSNDANDLLAKAVHEMQTKHFDEANDDLNKLIEKDSTIAEAYWLRGQISDIKGKDKSVACQDFQKASSLGFEKARQVVSQYCVDKPIDKYNKSLSEFTDFIKNHPDRFEGYYDRANLNFDYGFFKNAIEDYSIVISKNKYPVAYYNRGLSYLKLGDKEKARPDIQMAVQLGYPKAKDALPFCN